MTQKTIFKAQTEWFPPDEFPDLSKYDEISIDLETKDPDLKTKGTSSMRGEGDVVGIAGTIEELGGVSTGDSQWDGSGALEMAFDPALDKWAASILLPPGTSGSFALFVRRKDGTVIWERGERVLETTGVDGELYQMQWFE